MVENKGGVSTTRTLPHQDLSCISMRRGTVSVCEYITSGFCCFLKIEHQSKINNGAVLASLVKMQIQASVLFQGDIFASIG